ncbi:hypothetical protein FGG08_004007 [Glutinoglossum americanum]|uniref:Endonuclease/exonuclease/phosphatase family protein n=1 Tax=Glutinoglossum americanum TaxID=1670608 RepID=A0A9P8IC84_9PEZI|nr:hypothetical protein FGG08_004007 [Glutinoglossum americanum]
MQRTPPFRSFSSIFFLLALTFTTVPADPGSPGPPSSVQLRSGNVVNTSLAPFGPGGRGRTGSTDPASFKVLQLNLCNSGFAGCFRNGDSIPEGGKLIYHSGANVLTINEICSDDVAVLQPYLAEAWPADYTYSAFMPAIDKGMNSVYKCKNGFSYGSVVMGRVAATQWSSFTAYGGEYTSQDSGNEGRIFVCAHAAGDHFACTTHLSAKTETVALAQCKALTLDAVPYLKGLSGASGRTVIGGDFNLEYDTTDLENVQNCVPNGYTRKGDGDVQHVIFSNDLHFGSRKAFGLRYTDHDGFLVTLTSA